MNGLGGFLGQWRWICPCPLQRWQRPLHHSSSQGDVDRRLTRTMYTLLISIGMAVGVDGGLGVHTFMGEGDCCVAS